MGSFYHGIQSVIERIRFIIALNPSKKIISFVCFIIYKREDSFHFDLLHTIKGIHFIIDGIHSIMVFNPL